MALFPIETLLLRGFRRRWGLQKLTGGSYSLSLAAPCWENRCLLFPFLTKEMHLTGSQGCMDEGEAVISEETESQAISII